MLNPTTEQMKRIVQQMERLTPEQFLEQRSIEYESMWEKYLASNNPIDPYAVDSFDVARMLLANSDRMPFKDWLKQVGEQWSRMDRVSQYKEEFTWLLGDLTNQEQERGLLMTDEERHAYDELPEFVTVYRGCYEHNRLGLSWSLCKETASEFPFYGRYRHADSAPVLLKIERLPKACGFLKLDRGEHELALLIDLNDYLGDGVGCISIEELPIDDAIVQKMNKAVNGGRANV